MPTPQEFLERSIESDRPSSLENEKSDMPPARYAEAILTRAHKRGKDNYMIPKSKPKLNIHPWCIVRQLPNMQRLVVAWFYRRNDADGYIQVLRRLLPGANGIVFDVTGVEKVQHSPSSELEQLL